MICTPSTSSQHQFRGQRAVIVADQHDAMRMPVDQVADLLDLALGHEAAAVHEDDVRRERLDFVHTWLETTTLWPLSPRPRITEIRSRRATGSVPLNGSSKSSTRGSWTSAWASCSAATCPWNSRGSPGPGRFSVMPTVAIAYIGRVPGWWSFPVSLCRCGQNPPRHPLVERILFGTEAHVPHQRRVVPGPVARGRGPSPWRG